jgi:hypothetical protein
MAAQGTTDSITTSEEEVRGAGHQGGAKCRCNICIAFPGRRFEIKPKYCKLDRKEQFLFLFPSLCLALILTRSIELYILFDS